MSLKPTKYWNGNLSNMGKITAKKFPILLQMNEIIKGADKKTKKTSIFNLQKKLEDINDYLPLFGLRSNEFDPIFHVPLILLLI